MTARGNGMRSMETDRRSLIRGITAAALLPLAMACGGHNHLAEYNFANRSMALVYIAPPRPELVTGWYDIPNVDARTGREIWSFDVDGRNRLTPFLYGANRAPAGAITAAVLNTVTVADLHRALEQLVDFSSNEITERLRAELRDARN